MQARELRKWIIDEFGETPPFQIPSESDLAVYADSNIIYDD